jgi:hypothetical protein
MIEVKDIYYLAGLFEGEGSFMLRKQREFEYLSMSISMTDKDVIDKVSLILNFGRRREVNLPSNKIAYGWASNDQSRCAGLMMTLLPLMGSRRKQKIIDCLDRWKLTPLPKIQWTQCKNGHELSGDNLKITYEGKYEKRRCRECSKLRTRKYRAKSNAA